MPDELRLRVECDGGSRGNPGRAGAGSSVCRAVSAVRGEPEELAAEWEFLNKVTNNVAEYHSLINGIQLALTVAENHGVPAEKVTVDVFMDSKLVVEQMSGRWKIKHADMKPLAAQAKRLGESCAQVTYTWVPRAQNKRADQLANRAMDDGESGQWFADSDSSDSGASEHGASEHGDTASDTQPATSSPAPAVDTSPRAARTIDRLLFIACGTTGKDPAAAGLTPRARAAMEYTAARGRIDGVYPVGKAARQAAEEAAEIFNQHRDGALPVREIAELSQKSSAKIAQAVAAVVDKMPAADGVRHAAIIGHPDDLSRIIGWVLGSPRTVANRIYLDDGSLSIAEIPAEKPTETSEEHTPMLRRLNDVCHLR